MNSALRQRVLRVARTLFLKKGFDAVGMRDIAKALGMQPTQVYRMELSKIDILAEIIIELNAELIDTLPVLLQEVKGSTALECTCDYLLALYQFDIHFQPLRSVGAIHGWSWSSVYEAAVIEQVLQFLAPVAQWLQSGGLDDIPARCYGIWALYYVGYRRAVTRGGNAQECLAEILPSLEILLRAQ
jgi:AcrR family transcriptional regulator